MQKYARQSKLKIYKYTMLNVLLVRLSLFDTIAQFKNKHSDFMNVFMYLFRPNNRKAQMMNI